MTFQTFPLISTDVKSIGLRILNWRKFLVVDKSESESLFAACRWLLFNGLNLKKIEMEAVLLEGVDRLFWLGKEAF